MAPALAGTYRDENKVRQDIEVEEKAVQIADCVVFEHVHCDIEVTMIVEQYRILEQVVYFDSVLDQWELTAESSFAVAGPD
jgi:hypothetical protein